MYVFAGKTEEIAGTLLTLRVDIADGGDLDIGARLQHLHVTKAHAADSDDSDIDAIIGAEHARGGRQRGSAEEFAAGRHCSLPAKLSRILASAISFSLMPPT